MTSRGQKGTAKRPEAEGQAAQSLTAVLVVTGCLIVLIPAVFAMLCAIGYAVGLTLSDWNTVALTLAALLSLVLSGGVAVEAARSRWRRCLLQSATLAALLLAASLYAGTLFVDASGDGQWYHQEAIIRLAGTWNPLREVPVSPMEANRTAMVWIESYPHALWQIQAATYHVTVDLEAGKSWNVALALASLLLSAAALLRLSLSRWQALLLALAAAVNPVVSYQLFTYYNDGAVFSALLCLAALSALTVLDSGKALWTAWIGVFSFLGNIKFTGLIYGCFLATLLAWLMWRRRKTLAAILGVAKPVAAAVAVTLLLSGMSPYVTNTLRHGHPLYPYVGTKSVLETAEFHPTLMRAGGIAGLYYSIFSEPMWTPPQVPIHPKKLFRLTVSQVPPYRHWPDTSVGGYGIFFAEALLVTSLAFAVLAAVSMYRRRWSGLDVVLAVVLVLVLSIVLKPISWHARYNAQFVLVPVAMAAWQFFAVRRNGWHKAWLFAPLASVALLLFNAALVAQFNWEGQRELTAYIRNETAKVRRISERTPVPVYFGRLRSTRARWIAEGIRFEELESAKQLPCPAPVSIWVNHLEYCAPR